MRLIELDASFLKITKQDGRLSIPFTQSITEADGVMFQCPVCAKGQPKTADGKAFLGVHYLICWQPHVSQEFPPGPGRWRFEGTGLDDLTLHAPTPSILVKDGCNAHFFIRKGEIRF